MPAQTRACGPWPVHNEPLTSLGLGRPSSVFPAQYLPTKVADATLFHCARLALCENIAF